MYAVTIESNRRFTFRPGLDREREQHPRAFRGGAGDCQDNFAALYELRYAMPSTPFHRLKLELEVGRICRHGEREFLGCAIPLLRRLVLDA